MPDITMCTNETCNMRNFCWRQQANPSTWQSYSNFVPEADEECSRFIPMDGEFLRIMEISSNALAFMEDECVEPPGFVLRAKRQLNLRVQQGPEGEVYVNFPWGGESHKFASGTRKYLAQLIHRQIAELWLDAETRQGVEVYFNVEMLG